MYQTPVLPNRTAACSISVEDHGAAMTCLTHRSISFTINPNHHTLYPVGEFSGIHEFWYPLTPSNNAQEKCVPEVWTHWHNGS